MIFYRGIDSYKIIGYFSWFLMAFIILKFFFFKNWAIFFLNLVFLFFFV